MWRGDLLHRRIPERPQSQAAVESKARQNRTDGTAMADQLTCVKALDWGAPVAKFYELIPLLTAASGLQYWHKPKILVAIALAHKMGRQILAMLTKNEDYKDPLLAATG